MKTTAMRLSNIELFQIIKDKLGEKEAKSLVDYIETKVEDEFDGQRSMYASKEDLARVQGALDTKIEKFQGALETKIESAKNSIIIWTIASMIALLSLFKFIIN